MHEADRLPGLDSIWTVLSINKTSNLRVAPVQCQVEFSQAGSCWGAGRRDGIIRFAPALDVGSRAAACSDRFLARTRVSSRGILCDQAGYGTAWRLPIRMGPQSAYVENGYNRGRRQAQSSHTPSLSESDRQRRTL